MFERYTESSRRLIFFARQEALNAGHNEIETVDLLYGVAHEWPELRAALGLAIDHVESAEPARRLQKLIEKPTPINREIPFSEGSKNALRHAMQVADSEASSRITIRHILAGIVRADSKVGEQFQQSTDLTRFLLPQERSC